jgi:hypothetical protein
MDGLTDATQTILLPQLSAELKIVMHSITLHQTEEEARFRNIPTDAAQA